MLNVKRRVIAHNLMVSKPQSIGTIPEDWIYFNMIKKDIPSAQFESSAVNY